MPRVEFFLTRATRDDLEDVGRIYFEAYSTNFNALNSYPSSKRPSEDEYAKMWAAVEAEKWEGGGSDNEGVIWVKACVKGTTRAVGIAIWSTPQHWKQNYLVEPAYKKQETHAQVALGEISDLDCAYEGDVAEHNDRIKFFPGGKSNWFLMECAILPEFQGNGIGPALVKDGQARARADPTFTDSSPTCFLQSSPFGVPVYTRLGFKQIGMIEKRGKYKDEGVVGDIKDIEDGMWRYLYSYPTMVWVDGKE